MKLLFAALLATSAQAITYPLDVCRVRSGFGMERVHCQHFRPRGKSERLRSAKTVDNWVAVPCAQLKRHIPEVNCDKRFGFTKLGE